MTNPLVAISVDVSGSSTLHVFALYGYEPDQCKQMSVPISRGCTSTVTQRHSYRKRLAAFRLITGWVERCSNEGGIERLEGKRDVGIEGERNVIHDGPHVVRMCLMGESQHA